MPVRTSFALPVLTAALTGALLTGCAAGEDDDPTVAVPPAPSSSAAAPEPSAAATSPTPSARVVGVGFAGGQLTGETGRVETSLGESIVLRITSDVTEEIHVHGYDVYADVPAGSTVDIPLTTTLAGQYEVELHEAGRPILVLRTS